MPSSCSLDSILIEHKCVSHENFAKTSLLFMYSYPPLQCNSEEVWRSQDLEKCMRSQSRRVRICSSVWKSTVSETKKQFRFPFLTVFRWASFSLIVEENKNNPNEIFWTHFLLRKLAAVVYIGLVAREVCEPPTGGGERRWNVRLIPDVRWYASAVFYYALRE